MFQDKVKVEWWELWLLLLCTVISCLQGWGLLRCIMYKFKHLLYTRAITSILTHWHIQLMFSYVKFKKICQFDNDNHVCDWTNLINHNHSFVNLFCNIYVFNVIDLAEGVRLSYPIKRKKLEKNTKQHDHSYISQKKQVLCISIITIQFIFFYSSVWQVLFLRSVDLSFSRRISGWSIRVCSTCGRIISSCSICGRCSICSICD